MDPWTMERVKIASIQAEEERESKVEYDRAEWEALNTGAGLGDLMQRETPSGNPLDRVTMYRDTVIGSQ
jgi:hypothetical protein